jgi:uncharacterized membrane protein (DUF2068 family)
MRSPSSHLQTIPEGSHNRHLKGLRAVATLEFAKGVAVVLIAFGLMSLVHRDPWDVVEGLLEFLHIDPYRHFAQALLDLADRITEKNLLSAAGIALIYSSLRFVEAYGLWRARAWAEWLAFASGAIYLPFEIIELMKKFDLLRVAILAVNLAVVLYMLYLRTWGRCRDAAKEREAFERNAYETGG